MNDQDRGFLLGWLDAIWGAFAIGGIIDVPRDVQSKLIRQGWLVPHSTKDGRERTVTVSPSGASAVVEANKAAGIERHFICECLAVPGPHPMGKGDCPEIACD